MVNSCLTAPFILNNKLLHSPRRHGRNMSGASPVVAKQRGYCWPFGAGATNGPMPTARTIDSSTRQML